MNIQNRRELPMTKLHRTYNAGSDVVKSCLIFLYVVGALIASAIILITVENQHAYQIGAATIVICGILTIISFLDLMKKVKNLSEIAIQNAEDFDTECNDHDMTKFNLSLEKAEKPIPHRC